MSDDKSFTVSRDHAPAIGSVASGQTGDVDIEMVIGILEAALQTKDAATKNAFIAAALDYARNDQEALAEGRLWADPAPSALSTAEPSALSPGERG